MTERRLIEEWLPIAELGEESTRERRAMTALPPTYYLHVWWARRPLVASRAAVLASLLPEGADREKFRQVLGIHGDPVAARRRIEIATRKSDWVPRLMDISERLRIRRILLTESGWHPRCQTARSSSTRPPEAAVCHSRRFDWASRH